MTGPSAPAGWYPDPAGNGQRFWDGRSWAAAPVPPRPPKKSKSGKIAAGAVAGFVALMIVTNAGDDEDSASSVSRTIE